MKVLKSPDLEISDEVFTLFTDLIYRTAGIKLGMQKKGLLISRLGKRLKMHGLRNFHEYYLLVKGDNEELIEMLNCISTNTTKFFREGYHFEYLKNAVVPELLRERRSEKVIRIWSAGCSTGEEPYSIAIAVHEALRWEGAKIKQGGVWAGWDVKVLATDISTQVLQTAEAGVYEYDQIPVQIPPEVVGRYFLKGVRADAGRIKVRDFVKEMIRFRRLNLKDERYPFRRAFDVIFCRNVMIYFDEKMRRHVLSMFHRHLSERGYLFLGHSETMFGREQFEPVYITVYRKR